jgi:hypothetical protein
MGMVFVFVGDIGWGQVVPLFRSAMDGQTKRRMEPIRLEPDLLSLRIWSGSKDMDAIGLRLLLSLRICLEAKIWTALHGYSRSRAVRNCYHESIFQANSLARRSPSTLAA